MKKLVRLAAVSAMAFSMATGVAAASTGSIGTTGPDSYNKVESNSHSSVKVRNNNHVGVGNVNLQFAKSGDASVKHNTTGGGATSGVAANANTTNTGVTIHNSMPDSCGCAGAGGSNSGTINNTGPDSVNKVVFNSSNKVSVKNNNDVKVLNLSVQAASSGDAKVSGNTTGGSATSGAATNTNSTTTTVNISN